MNLSVRLFDSPLLKTKRFGRRDPSGTDLKNYFENIFRTIPMFVRFIGNTLNSLGPSCERDPFSF